MTKVKVKLNYDVPVSKLEAFGKLINGIEHLLNYNPIKQPNLLEFKENKILYPSKDKGYGLTKYPKNSNKKSQRKPLCKSLKETKDYVVDFEKKWMVSPTISKVASNFKISNVAASKRLERLRKLNKIRKK